MDLYRLYKKLYIFLFSAINEARSNNPVCLEGKIRRNKFFPECSHETGKSRQAKILVFGKVTPQDALVTKNRQKRPIK